MQPYYSDVANFFKYSKWVFAVLGCKIAAGGVYTPQY